MLLFLLACGPKTGPEGEAAQADYFPLVAGATYTYQAEYKGRQMTETRVLTPVMVGESEAFIFEVVEDVDKPSAIIFANMFGLGAYARRPEGLVTWPAMHRRDVEQAHSHGPAQLLLTLPPKPGDSVKLETIAGERIGAITVVGFEDVEVPAGRFTDCAHISLGSKAQAWLCPGVGLTRWEFPTGRIEELAERTLPAG